MTPPDNGPDTPDMFDGSGWKMFQRVAEDCPVAIFVTDTAGRHLFVNRQWCELTSLTPNEALGWGWEQAVHPADVRAVHRQWRRLITHGDRLRVEVRLVRTRGTTSTAIMHAVATPARDGRRRFVGTLTRLAATEQHRLADLGPWPALLDHSQPTPPQRHEPQRHEPQPYEPQRHEPQPYDRATGSLAGAPGGYVPKTSSAPESGAAVGHFRLADGAGRNRRTRPVADRLRRRPAAGVYGCDCLFSELLRAESACHDRERWLATVLEELPAAALLADADGLVEAVNQTFCDLFELAESASDLVGTDCRLLLRPLPSLIDDPAGFVGRLEELIQRRRPARREGVMFADGRVFERSHVPLVSREESSGDRYAGHLWIYVDVTARRILEAETEGLIAD